MTSGPERTTGPASRRGSTQSDRYSSDGRERPRAPMGPRTLQRPGSSRTQYSVMPVSPPTGASDSTPEAGLATPPSDARKRDSSMSPVADMKMLGSPTAAVGTSVQVMSAAQSEYSEPEVLPSYDPGYRSPEAVIEHVEDADTDLPPGIVAATFDNDKAWDAHESQSMYNPPAEHPERPQIGPGKMTWKWYDELHQHPLWKPIIADLPRPGKTPAASPTTSPTTSISSLDRPVTAPGISLEDVLDALPGGREGHDEWFFCPDCWGWFRIVIGTGDVPPYPNHHDRIPRPYSGETLDDEHTAWWMENSALRDIKLSRETAPHPEHHFHTFERLLDPAPEVRVPRVVVDGLVESFAHLDPGYGIVPPQLVDQEVGRVNKSELHVSCSTDRWVMVSGPVGGQLPKALAAEWTDEKRLNPVPGSTEIESANEAWGLVVTLLQNPLFREKKGFVKMSNPTFARKIGPSLRSIGFSCITSDEGYQVGPFAVNDTITEEHVEQMYKYMLRSWVEVSLYLQDFRRRNGLVSPEPFVRSQLAGEILNNVLQLDKSPQLKLPWGPQMREPLSTLGVSKVDTVDTIDIAYDFQMSEDHKNAAAYFEALEVLSNTHVPNIDTLRIKVAMQRSLDRFTLSDLDKAYARIGLDNRYLEDIMVTRTDLPAEHIYDKHREAMERATDPQSRQEVSDALVIVAKDRGDSVMQKLGKDGGVFLSLDQAYKEFNLTRDSNIDNEMLILQYETWIADKPSRADHYRQALEIIANAPGEERPQLQAFLAGKDISEFQGPVRRDIPAGLKNIGNTCYLNSVLQFLYAVKPIRDAVMEFEQPPVEAPQVSEGNNAAEKRVKWQSSCRFVQMLGELFRQMYETDKSAVVPAEELARLAILPIDLVDQRRDDLPAKGQITIDSLPTVLSPIASPTSSGVATAADTAPPTPTSPVSSGSNSPLNTTSPLRRPSVLGKRASEDRESSFGGSEERLRRLTHSDLIQMDSPTPGSPTTTALEPPHRDGGDIEMISDPPTRQESDLVPADAGLSGLDLASPMGEKSDPVPVPTTPKAEPRDLGIATPAATPPSAKPSVRVGEPFAMDYTEEAIAKLAPAGPPPLPPRRRSLALVAAEKFGLQQDAAEILINVLAQLEYAFDNGEGGNLIQRLFSAKFRQQMLLDSGSGLVESHDPVESVFSHPIIGVEEDDKDLYDCLAELYLGGAEIEYDGKKGYKMDLLDELPPALYILMRRSQYDFVKGRQTKTNTHIPFGDTLVMDRFMAGADPEKRERSIACTRNMMRMRQRRHELKNHKPLSVPDTFRLVRDALGDDKVTKALGLDDDMAALDSDITPELMDALGTEADRAEAEIAELDHSLVAARAEMEAMWASEHEVEYDLVSVFVHGGTGTGGHYWTYQADLPANGSKYFYYSDENVKDVPATDVFADKSSQGVSPALLVYVRRGHGLVDTLHRKPAPEPEAEVDEVDAGEGRGGGTEMNIGNDGDGTELADADEDMASIITPYPTSASSTIMSATTTGSASPASKPGEGKPGVKFAPPPLPPRLSPTAVSHSRHHSASAPQGQNQVQGQSQSQNLVQGQTQHGAAQATSPVDDVVPIPATATPMWTGGVMGPEFAQGMSPRK